MPRIPAVDPLTATGDAKPLLDAVQSSMGLTPNLMRTLANSPAALKGFLDLGRTLSDGVLDRKFRARIAMAVAQANACDYCLSAHSVLGGLAGLTPADLTESRSARSSNPAHEAGLKFAQAVVAHRGQVPDAVVTAARSAGLGDAEITEIVANVVLNIYTNYINHVAQTVIDFPPVHAAADVPA